ncbi:MAG: hypothetical protein ACYDHF_05865 [Candidatus Cryosericum sp.]
MAEWRADRMNDAGASIPSQAIENAVTQRSLQTLREWFTVKDEGLGEGSPACSATGSSDGSNTVEIRLCAVDIANWVNHWVMEASKFGEGASSRDLSAIPHNLDGASEHRTRLEALKKDEAIRKKEEDEQKRKEKRDRELYEAMDRLSAIARTPIPYVVDDTVAAVDERSLYAAFANQLRQNDLGESTVFDCVVELSRLVQEARAVLPRLTPDAVTQFEARILLDFYKKREAKFFELMKQQELESERMQAAKDLAAATRDGSEAVAGVSSRLALLNATAARQARDVATIKWVDMFDSLFGR